MRAARALALLAALSSSVQAKEPPKRARRVVLQRDLDGLLLGTATFAWVAGTLLQPSIVSHPPCSPCDPSGLNALDRPFAARDDPAANAASWGLVAVVLAAPPVIDAIAYRHPGPWVGDFVLYLEVLAVDGAINQMVKLAAQRPRPFAYESNLSDDKRASSETYVSFWSEHSSLAFAAATSTLVRALLEGRRGWRTMTVAALLFGGAAATAILRVAAGYHFPTDVLAGAAEGVAVGTLLPLARLLPESHLAIAPLPGGGMATLGFQLP